ncbi:hypothetical protein AURDEDRAFT_173904 [Auricularia subglabra TFB-10046 SS5]|nr:hypothetical protein AURDEDRAFT_173904 [Auricularia subglabra TFB-10046 SS5]
MTSRTGVTSKAGDSSKDTAGGRATSPTGTPKAPITRPSFNGIKAPGITTATTPKPATRRPPALSGRSVLNHDVKPGPPTFFTSEEGDVMM